MEYHSHTAGFNVYTSPVPYIAVGGGYYSGTVVNYSPPTNQGPDPVNISSPNVNLELKPSRYFDLQNSYVYTHFTNQENGDVVYDNHQLISRWNYQMNKAVSFNLIGQYLSTLPDEQYTDLTNSKPYLAMRFSPTCLIPARPSTWDIWEISRTSIATCAPGKATASATRMTPSCRPPGPR